jgi:hypothetical protein
VVGFKVGEAALSKVEVEGAERGLEGRRERV